MIANLNPEEYNSIKKSFFNIYSLYLSEDVVKRQYADCLFKWGIQLGINEEELFKLVDDRDKIQFHQPIKLKAIEQVYDLVYMIYLDGIVEDVELEVAMDYAEKLGFKAHIVGDLLKAIVTAPYDGVSRSEVRNELKEVLEADESQ